MLIDTYTMIVPQNGTLAEYEQFYKMYGNIVRNSILTWKMLDETKDILPNLFIEMTQNMRRHEKELPSSFWLIGVEYNAGKRKNYEKSIANTDIDEITHYFSNDLSLYIEFITNKQQFLNLYTAFEGTIRSYLREKYGIDGCKQEELMLRILEKEAGLITAYEQLCNASFTEEQITKIWTYYTALRNLYSHSGGYIGQKFLDTINGVKTVISDYLNNDIDVQTELSMFNNDNKDLFNFSCCMAKNKNTLFIISELNLRYFRNFIVHLWETIYTKNVPTVNIKGNYSLEKNQLTFRICTGQKESDALQKKDQNITLNNPCFNISGYVCPKCKDIGLFLYKAKFKPHIDISALLYKKNDSNYMARNVFTCPFCRSFFFPAYQEELKQNNGFNILNLNEVEYEKLLDLFESKADINYGW